jgi:hypothetical protein
VNNILPIKVENISRMAQIPPDFELRQLQQMATVLPNLKR